ncbi:hypothetical protein [Riemerella anatipestifer]|uniref:hypothetical protein n=1 Tax=Riemerella anatipestifer TaxID=34085 RepID=UPI0021D5E045|nr:hypothetical protein [Riemerella anatipestifer]MCU7542996.1 hypothetical protein [Riemerella anatipestifer]MCW0513645.1 hypothetical protein [Riemerella anatipestifer]
MRKAFILLLGSILIVSCKKQFENKGEITLKNGKEEDVTVKYNCNCIENKVDENTFVKLANEISNETKKNTGESTSYTPNKITIKFSSVKDLEYYGTKTPIEEVFEVKTSLFYSVKNMFGSELDRKNEDVFYLVNGEIDRELSSKIRLPKSELIHIYGSYILDREFVAKNEDSDFVKITPSITSNNEIQLSSNNSTREGGYGTTLVFYYFDKEFFKAKELLRLNSNSDISQDEKISFFKLTKEQIDKLTKNEVLAIRVKRGGNDFYCPINDNEKTYFQEFFAMPEVKKVLAK